MLRPKLTGNLERGIGAREQGDRQKDRGKERAKVGGKAARCALRWVMLRSVIADRRGGRPIPYLE